MRSEVVNTWYRVRARGVSPAGAMLVVAKALDLPLSTVTGIIAAHERMLNGAE